MDEKNERLHLKFPKKCEVNEEATVEISYEGVISDKLAGFYRSEYKDPEGNQKYYKSTFIVVVVLNCCLRFMAVTQFEPTDARRAFPCWDEPNKKATFDIQLEVQEQYVALSNMDVIDSRATDEGWKLVRYNRTPIMSTYLIAFVIGEIESIETRTKNGIPFRVWAPLGYVHQGKFALDVGSRTLDFFTEYFEQPYPLPKMDMIAIPDFASGAMENWGLVTYRMTVLLFDEKSSSLHTKEQVAYVVGHELAHQWFGNLVTMEWWSDLWLNEGFATWVGWLASDYLFPEWQIWTRFVQDDLNRALSLDALRSSHPIEVPVKDPAEINQIFDAISYSKGASVIRMLEVFLGTEVFRSGLRAYLAKFKFGNAKTADLWDSLSKASGKPVNDIMADWTLQMGYPVITVKDTGVAADKGDKMTLSCEQHRFLSTGDVKPDEDQLLWHVPLSAQAHLKSQKKIHNASMLLSDRTQDIKLPSDSIVKLNPGQTGFYRVMYPDGMLHDLGAALQQFSIEDRLGIFNDLFVFGSSGYSSSVKALSLLKYLSEEQEYVVWAEIAGQLGRIKAVWYEEPEDVKKRLEKLVCNLVSPLATSLGWEYLPSEDDKTSLLRTLVIPLAAHNGNEALLAEAQARFKRYIKGDESALHPNLRGAVLALNVKFGGKAEHDAVFELYKRTMVADQKTAALSALTATRDAKLIADTLELSLSEHVRPQDVIYIFRSIVVNEKARRPAWEFVKARWDDIYGKFSRGSISLLSSIVAAVTGSLASKKDAQDIKHFFSDKDTSTFTRVIEQSLEKITIASNWLDRDRHHISKWLKENVA